MTLNLSRRSLTSLTLLFSLTLTTACHPSAPVAAQSAPTKATPMVYTLHPSPEDSHVDVSLEFLPPSGAETISLQLPVWSPGDYHRQDFPRYVQNIKAYADGKEQELVVSHPNAETWQIPAAGAGRLRVVYSLPKMPPGFFSENVAINAKQGFINGPAALMYVVGHKDWPAELDLKLPEGWIAATPLKTAPLASGITAAFTAPDYDTLADSPLLFGAKETIVTREFSFNGVKHTIVFFDHLEAMDNFDAYTPMLKSVVETETKIMGGVTPYPQYMFYCDIGGPGGGLEHLNACRVALFPRANPNQLSPFFAHEFFHCWNVKRIRPAVLGPFDYVKPPITRNLWFAEGVTEYYSRVATCRAGLVPEATFFRHYNQAIRRFEANPAHLKTSADDSSLHVWEAGGSQGSGGISYYDKGELIGLCLDLTIRHETHNRKSLDDVMRLLMQRHNPPKPGYGEDAIRDIVNEVAGKDLSALYNRLARSPEEMPFAECLGYAGLSATLTPLPDATPEQVAILNSWTGAKP